MGTDIWDYLEVRDDTGRWNLVPETEFPREDPYDAASPLAGLRSYAMFAFIADVRNRYDIPPLARLRGLPNDLSDDLAACLQPWQDMHAGESWLTLDELLDVDYDRPVQRDDEQIPLREFLGEWFIERIHWLRRFGPPRDVRIVFLFDC